jgi:hypothetical protein
MARYKERDETDLVWNRIRRQITRDLDTEIQNRREEALNILLTNAWQEYVKSLQTGEVRELESKYTRYITTIVDDLVPEGTKLDGSTVD